MNPEDLDKQNKRVHDFINAKANVAQNKKLAAQNEELAKQTESLERQEQERIRQTQSLLRQENALEEERAEKQRQEQVNAKLFELKTLIEKAEAGLPLRDERKWAEYLIDKPYEELLNPNLYNSLEWKQCAVDTGRLIERFEETFKVIHAGVIESIEQERLQIIEAAERERLRVIEEKERLSKERREKKRKEKEERELKLKELNKHKSKLEADLEAARQNNPNHPRIPKAKTYKEKLDAEFLAFRKESIQRVRENEEREKKELNDHKEWLDIICIFVGLGAVLLILWGIFWAG